MFDVFNTFTVIITIKGSIIVDTITKPIMFVVPMFLIVFFIICLFYCYALLTLQIYSAFTYCATLLIILTQF